MAVGAKNIRMIRALMQWRRELNRSLEDGLDSLGHRRDMFIQEAMSSSTTADGWPSSGGKTTTYDIGRFEKWLSEERRRLVRVTELRCEECWRKAVTARDNMGRTPLHYAVAGGSQCFVLKDLNCSFLKYRRLPHFRSSWTRVSCSLEPRNSCQLSIPDRVPLGTCHPHLHLLRAPVPV